MIGWPWQPLPSKVVHRDLKPDNVALASGGQVKILGFGLAKLLDERGEVRSAATGGGPGRHRRFGAATG